MNYQLSFTFYPTLCAIAIVTAFVASSLSASAQVHEWTMTTTDGTFHTVVRFDSASHDHAYFHQLFGDRDSIPLIDIVRCERLAPRNAWPEAGYGALICGVGTFTWAMLTFEEGGHPRIPVTLIAVPAGALGALGGMLIGGTVGLLLDDVVSIDFRRASPARRAAFIRAEMQSTAR